MMSVKRRTGLRVSSAVVSIPLAVMATAAHTQTLPQPATSTETGESRTAQDIIVTALKSSQSLQKTPAAISVVTSEDIVKRQLTDIRGLSTFIPSVKTNVESTATQFFIRGIGKQVDQARIPEAVGMVVDGLNIPQHGSGLALFDVASIEVLPGPQGTLYGSSAIGGVVNINTRRPTRELETAVLLEAGNYGTIHAVATQNIPLTKDWAIRAAYNGFYHGAYNNNGTYNDHMTAFRLSSLFEPSGSDLSVFLSATYAFDKFKQSPTIPLSALKSGAYRVPPFDPATAFFYPPNGARLDNPHTNVAVTTANARVDWTPGDLTVSYIGGYLHLSHPNQRQIVAGFVNRFDTDIDQFSNELRVANAPGSRLSLLGGLYQSHANSFEFYVFGPNLSGWDYTIITNTYAAYGQATFALAEGTQLTGGLRVSQDTISTTNGQVFFPTGAPPIFGRGVIPFSFRRSWERLNWKAGFEQDLGRRSMFYAAVQSGFNPGTFDGNPPDPARDVKPQSMVAYTAGIKNRFFGSRLTLNLEGFLYDYKDQIITAPDLTTGQTALLNAPKSRVWGVQLDTTYDLDDNTSLHANVGYLNAKFTEFVAGSARGPVDYSGNALSFSPEFTASIGTRRKFELGNSGSIEARADSYISSSYWFSYNNILGFKQSGFTKTDASLTYAPPSGIWQIGLWVKNIENRATAASAGETAGRPYPGVVYAEPPRTFGARLSVRLR